MSRSPASRSCLVAALLACTAIVSPAQADLAPAEVWNGLKGYFESFGYDVSGAETGGADDLTVADTLLSMTLPDSEGTITVELGQLQFMDTGDAVAISFPEVMPIRFDLLPQSGAPAVQGVVEYRQAGLEMSVSGSASDMDFTYAAEALDLALTELSIDGEARGADVARAQMTLSEVAGETQMTIAALRDVSQGLTMGEVSFDVFFADPSEPTTLSQFTGSWKNLDMTSEAKLPLIMDMTDFPALLASGFTLAATMTHQGSSQDINATDRGEILASSTTTASGVTDLSLGGNAMSITSESRNVTMQTAGGDLPFPVALTAETTQFGLAGPLSKTDGAAPFAFNLTLGSFEMNDLIWSLLDPTGQLPRDPATLEIDLSGMVRVLLDMFDPQSAMAIQQGARSLELDTLALNALTLDAAGAKLTGEGAFTLDNTDRQTFRGLPRPEGEVTLELTGANKLIDTLVRMGIIPQEQAMGARMMMAMFAQPVGDDQLRSKIEINSSGHVLANGQRIQ
ncbi:DUF2125 domain-containing protein [Primorskyibacter sp. S187A]|uniref:DUF2125 domain-containing protein n=1 Tax=Primorskyibacter sp. S187A TaxID=3415130 RepID=UPI003C7A30C1